MCIVSFTYMSLSNGNLQMKVQYNLFSSLYGIYEFRYINIFIFFLDKNFAGPSLGTV
jgi:hypothetical protein